MSVKIRLARAGAKKKPYYHIVVADSRNPRDGSFIEQVGTYNPMVAKDAAGALNLNVERIKYWLGVGAQPTDRVARFVAKAGLTAAYAPATTPKKSAPKAKAQERMKAAAAAAEAKAAEEAAAKAEAEKAFEAPVAEEKVEEAAPAAAEEPKAE